MKKSINIDWECMGAEFAILDDENQAKFFKGFVAELNDYESHYSREMQMASINLKLTDEEKTVLAKYLPTIFIKGDE